MSHDVYYDFFQTPEQVRRQGARGGRSTARNRRERLSMTPEPLPQPDLGSCGEYAEETAAAAIALLDAEFPWLQGAERRHRRR